MYEQIKKKKEKERRAIANSVTQRKNEVEEEFGFVDNQPEYVVRQKQLKIISNRNLQHKPVIQKNATQLYTPVEGEGRESTDHRFMIINSKSLWTYQGDLDDSNEILNAKNSFVKLVKTGLSFGSTFGGTMYEIAPEWNTKRGARIPETQRLSKANKDANGYTTHADCFMNAQTVMGVEDTATGSLDTTAPIFEQDGQRSQILPVARFPAGPGDVVSSNAPTRGYLAFLEHAMPLFYRELKNKGNDKTVAENDFLKEWTRESRLGIMAAYRKLTSVVKYAPLLHRFSEKFGINEYMSPEIGEGLAIINNPYERNEMQDKIQCDKATAGDQLWNYHFAGVVMKDGDDYVTLENYSVENGGVDNQNWIFQMYGIGAQSFHSEIKMKKGIGTSSLSLGYTASK